MFPQYCACTSNTRVVLIKLSSLNFKNWWVIYKVNSEIHTHRYDEYIERYENDDGVVVYKEEIKGQKSLTISDGNDILISRLVPKAFL
jgi:arginine/lysine/ornithine decarboxylase